MPRILHICTVLALALPLGAQFTTNATKLRGRSICATTPTNAYALVWNSTSNCWGPAASGGIIATADQGYFVGVSIQVPTAATTNTAAFTANQTKVWQFVLPHQATIGKIVFEVVTGAGSLCGGGADPCSAQFGLWNADLTTVAAATGVLTSGGSPDINSAAVLTKSITAVSLAPGVYNLVMTTDSTALVLRGITVPSQMINALNGQTVDKWGVCANAGVAGALPASCGAVTGGTAIPPIVTFER